MSRAPWTPERHRQLQELARRGLTGAEIAAKMGLTRSAVLGRAFRTGVSLPMTDEKAARRREALAAGRVHPRPRRPDLPSGHALLRKRPGRCRAYSDAEIATAIAGRLAGLSYRRAAALVGAGCRILELWMTKPELRAQGQALFERAMHEASIAARRRAAIAEQERAAEAARIEATNAPLFSRMKPRDALVCRRLVDGERDADIARSLNVTRERIRQIKVKWQIAGLCVPQARQPTEAAIRVFGPQVARELERGSPKVKRTRRLSDAERQRRSDWMREVSRRRLEARA